MKIKVTLIIECKPKMVKGLGGLKRSIKALGPKRSIKALGPKRSIKALGPKRSIKALKVAKKG